MLKRLSRRPGVQAMLAWLLGHYLRFALRTTRWTLHGEQNVAPHMQGAPVVVAFWHECLPLMPALWMRARRQSEGLRMHVLVSRHHDGRFIGEMMRGFHLETVHGSTQRDGRDRGGAASVMTMLDLLDAGDMVGLTPDGPRGPARRSAPGVAQLAARSGVPVLPCAARTTRRIVLGTWDRMIVPLPFGRGVMVCGPAISVPRENWQDALPGIDASLTEAALAAERLCG
jgi:lysophospholipid acyltransferase (LPLAT)-like uncharacterized protein